MAARDAPIILICDDTPISIKILADVLREHYQVKVTAKGEDALERAQCCPQPDLILLDVMMPEMDGYEVCRRLKQKHSTRAIPIIFVTAKDATSDQRLGFDLGGVDYVTKPFSIPVLEARVRVHITLKRQSEILEKLSYVDALTGIANRRQLDHSLEVEHRRLARECKAFSALMIDIDHFKDYNDHYGHGAGDACLRQIATTLVKTLSRPGDLVARYGGEEFTVLLPGTNSAAAYTLAEQLRESVLGLKLPYGPTRAGSVVSISIGCATTRPFFTVEPANALLEKADKMLYHAKQTGRNKTVDRIPDRIE